MLIKLSPLDGICHIYNFVKRWVKMIRFDILTIVELLLIDRVRFQMPFQIYFFLLILKIG